MKRVGDKPVDDADAKRSRADEATLHVYEPCVVLPLAEHMNALVEARGALFCSLSIQTQCLRVAATQVLVPSRYLAADCKAVKQRRVWGAPPAPGPAAPPPLPRDRRSRCTRLAPPSLARRRIGRVHRRLGPRRSPRPHGPLQAQGGGAKVASAGVAARLPRAGASREFPGALRALAAP